MNKTLIFVDTNILLDFYRVRDNKMGSDLLKKLAGRQNALITSVQVQAEFLNRRRETIASELEEFAMPNLHALTVAPIFEDEELREAKKIFNAELKKKYESVRGRILSFLEDPIGSDPVYKLTMSLFEKARANNLSHGSDFQRVFENAHRRYLCGWAPRKSNDKSFGDAINWEWILEVAKRDKSNVIIVSRDGDYGHHEKKKSHLNEFLAHEFRTKVGSAFSVRLTKLLSEALEEVGATISKDSKKKEAEFVELAQIQSEKDVINSQLAIQEGVDMDWYKLVRHADLGAPITINPSTLAAVTALQTRWRSILNTPAELANQMAETAKLATQPLFSVVSEHQVAPISTRHRNKKKEQPK